MINTCKILRVIAIRTYWAEQLIFWSKMGISAQYVRIVRIGHSYVLGSNIRLAFNCILSSIDGSGASTYVRYLKIVNTFWKKKE